MYLNPPFWRIKQLAIKDEYNIEQVYRKTKRQQASQRKQQIVWSILRRNDPSEQRRTPHPKHKQSTTHN